jgi:molecular chaperone GrpE
VSDEVVDAEVVDAEVVDAEVVDAEVVDAEVVDAEILRPPNSIGDGTGLDGGRPDPSDEDVMLEVIELAQRLESEKNEYLDLARRVQADFENYRKRVSSERNELAEQATVRLVGELLPVLDACEAALAHGADGVGPIHAQLSQTLTKQGLAPVADAGVPFDPNIHEAVLTESSDEPGDPVVAEVLRTGYLWNGRVVRAAMVKVRG